MLQKGYSCTVTLGPIPGLSEAAAAAAAAGGGPQAQQQQQQQLQEQQQLLQQLANAAIEEDKQILAFEVSRKTADKRYQESYLDEFGIPADLQT